MGLADWGAILTGLGLGILLASIMHSRAIALEKRRRRERGVLHSVGERAKPDAPFNVDRDGNYATDFDHPETKDKLRSRLDEMRTYTKEKLQRTFTDEGRFNWIVHSEYHLSLWLLGEWLQYWPTKEKFRWRHRTYTGDVEAFIREQLEEYERRVIFE